MIRPHRRILQDSSCPIIIDNRTVTAYNRCRDLYLTGKPADGIGRPARNKGEAHAGLFQTFDHSDRFRRDFLLRRKQCIIQIRNNKFHFSVFHSSTPSCLFLDCTEKPFIRSPNGTHPEHHYIFPQSYLRFHPPQDSPGKIPA